MKSLKFRVTLINVKISRDKNGLNSGNEHSEHQLNEIKKSKPVLQKKYK